MVWFSKLVCLPLYYSCSLVDMSQAFEVSNILRLPSSRMFRLIYIGDVFTAISQATATCDSHIVYGQSLLTCLGHLGRHDINRNDPIFVVLPKVAKASK